MKLFRIIILVVSLIFASITTPVGKQKTQQLLLNCYVFYFLDVLVIFDICIFHIYNNFQMYTFQAKYHVIKQSNIILKYLNYCYHNPVVFNVPLSLTSQILFFKCKIRRMPHMEQTLLMCQIILYHSQILSGPVVYFCIFSMLFFCRPFQYLFR